MDKEFTWMMGDNKMAMLTLSFNGKAGDNVSTV